MNKLLITQVLDHITPGTWEMILQDLIAYLDAAPLPYGDYELTVARAIAAIIEHLA